MLKKFLTQKYFWSCSAWPAWPLVQPKTQQLTMITNEIIQPVNEFTKDNFGVVEVLKKYLRDAQARKNIWRYDVMNSPLSSFSAHVANRTKGSLKQHLSAYFGKKYTKITWKSRCAAFLRLKYNFSSHPGLRVNFLFKKPVMNLSITGK